MPRKRIEMNKRIPQKPPRKLPRKLTPAAPQVFGYARVSTRDQNLDMQIEALKRAGVSDDNLIVEKASGSRGRRPQFENLLKAVRPGDTVIVWRMDRFGRKTLSLLQQLAWFREHNIEFKSLTEQIDFNTPMGRVFAAITAALAQFEVEMTAMRTKAGIATVQAAGKPYGRKIEFDLAKAKAHLRRHKNISAAAAHVGVDRQRLWYHVEQDAELLRLLKINRK